jgi:hypothetical protein
MVFVWFTKGGRFQALKTLLFLPVTFILSFAVHYLFHGVH